MSKLDEIITNINGLPFEVKHPSFLYETIDALVEAIKEEIKTFYTSPSDERLARDMEFIDLAYKAIMEDK